jgi:glycosyltransferase involved in cell wall biosynthesis
VAGKTALSFHISVAMCTFNGGRFLRPQLDSIAAQDRLPDELVLCDDGSSDSSVEVVRRFAQGAAFPIRLVVNQEKLGSTKNFEKAISLCQGEIVALADQDDVWYPHKLKNIEKAFLASEEIVSVFSDADLIDQDSQPLPGGLWASFSFNLAKQRQFGKGDALNVLVRHPVVTGSTLAFQKEFFHLLTPIPTDEIHDRWIAFMLAACGRFQIIPTPLMQYRRHDRQQVGLPPRIHRERMARAKTKGKNSYIEEINRFREIYGRLQSRRSDFRYAESALKKIEQKLSHLEHRAYLPGMKVARVPRVLFEILNGHYWRYSGGWISIAKDLMVR